MSEADKLRLISAGWIAAALLIVASFLFPVAIDITGTPTRAIDVALFITAAVFFAVGVTRRLSGMRLALVLFCLLLSAGALTVQVHLQGVAGDAGGHFWLKVLGFWVASWMLVEALVHDAESGLRKVSGWEIGRAHV